jgi:hypothetical protein
MGLVTGIDAIKAAVEKSNADFEDSPRAKWFKLADGQSKKVVFLQEFDENSPEYSEKNGTVLVAVEHSAPKDYKRKALCTIDDGACLPCEMNKKFPKTGWNQKTRLYANVLVLDGSEPEVQVLSQGLGGKSITPTLFEMSNEYGSITKNPFKIKRTGSSLSNTSYALIPQMTESGISVEDYELYDLVKVATRNVDYEEQATFYGVEEEKDPEEPSAEAGSDFDW